MTPQRIYLFGAGGHGRELGWLARDAYPGAELAYLVDDERFLSKAVNGIPVRLVSGVRPISGDRFVVAVGSSQLRQTVSSVLEAIGLRAVALVHPRAEFMPTARVDDGAVVAAGCIVSDRVEIGRHAHVNIGCSLSHDVVVGDFATISPGVHIAGNVRIGNGAFVGIGASVINGAPDEPLVIGAGAVVAAGACVTRAVAPGDVVAGVPARPLRKDSV